MASLDWRLSDPMLLVLAGLRAQRRQREGSPVVWLASPPPTLEEWDREQARLQVTPHPGGRVIALPVKATSAEQWAADCLHRFNMLPPSIDQKGSV